MHTDLKIRILTIRHNLQSWSNSDETFVRKAIAHVRPFDPHQHPFPFNETDLDSNFIFIDYSSNGKPAQTCA